MSEITKEAVKEYLSNLSVLELNQLVKELEEEWGVSAAAPVAVATAPASAETAPVQEEPTEFDVILAEYGSQKLNVIKAVRQITDLGLKEAKSLVESAPTTLKERLPKEEAEKIKKMFEEIGAKIEVKAAAE